MENQSSYVYSLPFQQCLVVIQIHAVHVEALGHFRAEELEPEDTVFLSYLSFLLNFISNADFKNLNKLLTYIKGKQIIVLKIKIVIK